MGPSRGCPTLWIPTWHDLAEVQFLGPEREIGAPSRGTPTDRELSRVQAKAWGGAQPWRRMPCWASTPHHPPHQIFISLSSNSHPPTPATRSPSAFVMPVLSLVWPHSFLKSSPPSSGSAAARMTKAEMGLHRSDPIKPASCPAPLTQILHLPPAPPLLPPARPSLRHLVQPGLCERLCRERSA